jgi:hypothetical protein
MNDKNTKKYSIGIDCGVKTGVCVYDITSNSIKEIGTYKIHRAMELVLSLKDYIEVVIVEDARLRKWFGNNSKQKVQGAGSIKRDAVIWEDFLKDYKINYKMVHPIKGGTKISEHLFNQISGYEKRTSNHARDAYFLATKFY